jgi:hypothetical protein
MAKQTFTTGQVLTAAQMTSLQQTAMGGGAATAKTASYVLVAADAGTTVIMNSASATTITVNTSLFSAGDTIFLQNIGAGVSTITPGTATVNTASSLALAQYESGNLYFTAAGASIFSKSDGAGAASGSRGLNEIIPTSVAVGSGTATVGTNGMITFTTVGTSLSVNGCFNSTYTNYTIVMDFDVSAFNYYGLRLRVGGTDNTTATSYKLIRLEGFGSSATSARTNADHFQDFVGAGNAATNGATFTLYRPFEADTTALSLSDGAFSDTAAVFWRTNGFHNQNTSYDGFTLMGFSGTTITGKMRIYGWQE